MIDFKQMNEQIRNAGRIVGIIKAENDSDVMAVCLSETESLSQAQAELKPLIDSLDNYTERMAMILRYLKGYDFYRIADHLSITERTVFRYLKRAKIKLSEMYPDRIELE